MNPITARIQQEWLQERTQRILGAKRDVDIYFTDKTHIEFKEADIVSVTNGCYLVYLERTESVYRYPIDKVFSITEALIIVKDEGKEKKSIVTQ